MKTIKSILYLRTDLTTQKVVAGGSVAHTLGVIEGFLKKKIKIICATSFMAEQINSLQPQALKKLYIPSLLKRIPWRLLSFISSFFFFFQTKKLIKKNLPIDALYQRYSLLNYTGLLVRWWYKIPLILEFNGSEYWVDQNWSGKSRFKFGWLVRLVEEYNIRYADYIVVVSQVLKDNLVKNNVNHKKILVNPNGVNPDFYNAAILTNSRNLIRKKLNIDDSFVFGFVSTFSIWHGINILKDMIPAVVTQNMYTHFLLIGEGPLRIELEEHLQKNNIEKKYVTFTGMIPQHEARNYLAACDAFLSPTQQNKDGSRFFGSPTKLFEYMSMAKPIIASDLEQLAEIINQDSGILVKSENQQEFVYAAQSLLNKNKQKLDMMGKCARKRVIECYTWDSHVQHIIDFTTSL